MKKKSGVLHMNSSLLIAPVYCVISYFFFFFFEQNYKPIFKLCSFITNSTEFPLMIFLRTLMSIRRKVFFLDGDWGLLICGLGRLGKAGCVVCSVDEMKERK